MDEVAERQQLVDSVLMSERMFYSLLQAGAGRYWIEVDLTMPQLKVLFLVNGSAGVRMTQLARSLAMTLSTATGVVDRLVGQGLIRREQAAHDRRLVLLHPTERGAVLVQGLLEVGRARFGLILDRLSLDDLRMTARTLDLLYAAAMGVAEEETVTESAM
jgi:DNA-binding MarR family transcriptional regulator